MKPRIVWSDFPNRVLSFCTACGFAAGTGKDCANCRLFARLDARRRVEEPPRREAA